MNKDMLKQKIEEIAEIAEMDRGELEDLKMLISSSGVGKKAKDFLYRAIDIRQKEITSRFNAFVVDGELDDME